jgi:hypothetical protein
VSVSDDLKAFIAEHREHGQLTGDATERGLPAITSGSRVPVA